MHKSVSIANSTGNEILLLFYFKNRCDEEVGINLLLSWQCYILTLSRLLFPNGNKAENTDYTDQAF